MKITKENIKDLPISESNKEKLGAILKDIEEINNVGGWFNSPLYIDWQDYHNEYSPERTDPCPDYYGYYTFRIDNSNYHDHLGLEMDLDELDNSVCLIFDIVYAKKLA